MQPGQGLQTSVSDVELASKHIEISHGNLNAIQRNLTTALDPLLVGVSWRGAAATKFSTLYTNYATQVNRIHASLELLGQLVNKSSKTYDQGELDATGMVNKVEVPTNITSALAGN